MVTWSVLWQGTFQWCWWIKVRKMNEIWHSSSFLKCDCVFPQLLGGGHERVPYPPSCSLLVLPLVAQLHNRSTYVSSKWWHKFCKAFCTILRFWNHDNMLSHLLCFTERKCMHFTVRCPDDVQQSEVLTALQKLLKVIRSLPSGSDYQERR